MKHRGKRDGDKGTGAGPQRARAVGGGGEGGGYYRVPPSLHPSPSLPSLHFTYIICIIQILLWAHPAWMTSPHRDAMLRLHVDKAINGNRPKSANVIFVLVSLSWCFFSLSVSLSLLCPHPERSQSSRPIQKCPIIIDLSVLIFINNCACDDPAGMLMSPQLELISCRHRSGRLSFFPPVVVGAAVKCTHPCTVRFVTGPVDDKTLHEITFLFSPNPEFHF